MVLSHSQLGSLTKHQTGPELGGTLRTGGGGKGRVTTGQGGVCAQVCDQNSAEGEGRGRGEWPGKGLLVNVFTPDRGQK